MKNKTKLHLAISMLVLVSGILFYVTSQKPQTPQTPPQTPPPPPPPRAPQTPHVSPEFRNAPIKKYKPGHTQQMGILTGGGETLPLFGKAVRGRRDRFHYYTTTGGDNLYPLPITYNGRDCIEDIGCEELYGNETVSVTGKTGSFIVTLYRTDNFF